MRTLLSIPLLVLAFSLPVCAQGWRPFEVDLSEDLVNDALERRQEDAERARRTAPPEPEPETLGEAFAALGRALVRVGGTRVDLDADRMTLRVHASVFALVRNVLVIVDLELVPRMRATNVIELTLTGGREKFGERPWEPQSTTSLRSNLRKLRETLDEGELAGSVSVERGQGGAPDALLVDLSRLAALDGVELHSVTLSDGQLTVAGATRREQLELEVGARDVNEGLRRARRASAMTDLDVLLGPNSWIDVGRETPGRITVHGKASLPWLPETPYAAIFNLEAIGPRRLRLTLEDVRIGGDTMDGFLRSRVGARIKAWLLAKIYARLDDAEREVAAAYARGEADLLVTHTTPNVRIVDLRPGWAGGATVRPGFALESLSIERGAIRLGARLEGEPLESSPSAFGARGILGALGDP